VQTPEVVKPKFGSVRDREERGAFKIQLLVVLAQADRELLSVEVGALTTPPDPRAKAVAPHLSFLQRKGLVAQGRGRDRDVWAATWRITPLGERVLASAKRT
jgi:hypothetical protein